VAARALDAALGTGLFSAGLELGTARTVLRF
jgi:predicted RNA methylase